MAAGRGTAVRASRGYHATAGTTDSGHYCRSKAPRKCVLPRCGTWWAGDSVAPLTPRSRRRVRDQLTWLTGQGYRVLAVAETDRPTRRALPTRQSATCVSWDSLPWQTRYGRARGSLDELRGARTQIVMITGDHPSTAETIARELGILDGQRVITGAEIDALDDVELAELVGGIAVVARGTPAHKVRVVRAFQAKGRVVAMTGDGANDAPAIRLADVGIALGQRATPAARAAADLVVTDDRLETIIAALVEGRAM